ncbi:eCIS core domain-containing protein [Haladaptatus sp. NG-SE-30]
MDRSTSSRSGVVPSRGRSLDRDARSFFESRFGVDFSGVRIYTDGHANTAASLLNARAFTHGSDVYFPRGAYELNTTTGSRLIAYELAHTLQQRSGEKIVQRKEDEVSKKPATRANSTARIGYYVVRDRGLNADGGTYVPDLEALKRKIQTFRTSKRWTLVLSVHGSENRLGAQSPPDWQRNAKFYGPADIDRIFGNDRAFVHWRDRWGPSRLVLNECQVIASFKRVLIRNLTRVPVGATSRVQQAQGLGTSCKPLTTTPTLQSGVRTLQRWQRLPDAQRERDRTQMESLNRRWGYFGRPPVPNDRILQYYFEETPSPGWPKVEVGVERKGKDRPLNPPVPFYSRMSHSGFLEVCNQGIDLPRRRQPRVPPSPIELGRRPVRRGRTMADVSGGRRRASGDRSRDGPPCRTPRNRPGEGRNR